MAKRITGDRTISVTAAPQDVEIGYRDFFLVNNSDAVVYFREKGRDGKAVTASTGYALQARSQMPQAITADVLSIVGSGAADVRILFID
ncbi:hypothetical protein [Evtepia sp.]|uniref:hypothetical protein n=1 Tax=Evtepia sp. TaxID=2773933 RepID=UPI003F16C391